MSEFESPFGIAIQERSPSDLPLLKRDRRGTRDLLSVGYGQSFSHELPSSRVYLPGQPFREDPQLGAVDIWGFTCDPRIDNSLEYLEGVLEAPVSLYQRLYVREHHWAK